MPEPAPPDGSSVYPLVTVAFITVVFPAVPDTVPARIIASLWSVLPDPPLSRKLILHLLLITHAWSKIRLFLEVFQQSTCFQQLSTMTEDIFPAGRRTHQAPAGAGRPARPGAFCARRTADCPRAPADCLITSARGRAAVRAGRPPGRAPPDGRRAFDNSAPKRSDKKYLGINIFGYVLCILLMGIKT